MGIRTGKQYLDKLNGMTPQIYVDGEQVTSDVTEHPLFRNNARTYAHLFDMQHDPVYADDLTWAPPATGERVNTSFLVPHSEADLVRRRKAFSAWTDFSHGFLGRSGDYMNSALTALASATTFFKDVDPAYGERIRAYYEFASHNDLLATHTLVPPQVNRSVVASQQAGGRLTARIVEERGNGVVVRGARLLATLGPIADELLVVPSTVLRGTPEDEIEKALLRAAEADGELSEDGVFLPQWSTLNAARNWYPRKVSQRLPEIIRKFSASGLMALPGEADFALAAREGRADLDTYLQAATATAQQRARLFKLALDAAVSGFAGREALYEYFFFGDPVRMAEAQVGGYDREPARARVRALLADADADADAR